MNINVDDATAARFGYRADVANSLRQSFWHIARNLSPGRRPHSWLLRPREGTAISLERLLVNSTTARVNSIPAGLASR